MQEDEIAIKDIARAEGIDCKCILCGSSEELEVCRYYYGSYSSTHSGGAAIVTTTHRLTNIKSELLILCGPCIIKGTTRLLLKQVLLLTINIALAAGSLFGALFFLDSLKSTDWRILVVLPLLGLFFVGSRYCLYYLGYLHHFFHREVEANSKVGADVRPRLTLDAPRYRDSQYRLNTNRRSTKFISKVEFEDNCIEQHPF